MILREVSMRIKALAPQGVPRAEIARQYGVCRQTVYNHLNRESSGPNPRKGRPPKLDPYRSTSAPGWSGTICRRRYSSRRSGRWGTRGKAIILTSKKSYGQWDEVFPDRVLATALLDRLLHHATTINIRGESYRLRHRREAGLTPPTWTEEATTGKS